MCVRVCSIMRNYEYVCMRYKLYTMLTIDYDHVQCHISDSSFHVCMYAPIYLRPLDVALTIAILPPPPPPK